MSRPLDVVVVNGSPNERSKTAALAELITDHLAELVPVTVRRIDVYRLGPGFTGSSSLPVGFYVSAGDFDGTTVLNAEVYSRIEVGLGDVLPRLRGLYEERGSRVA